MIVDMLTFAGLDAAYSLRIPLAMNIPGPAKVLSLLGLPSFTNSTTLFGFTILSMRLKFYTIRRILVKNLDSWINAMNSLIIVNSFFGLDEPMVLPPNVRMVGPLLSREKPRIEPFDK